MSKGRAFHRSGLEYSLASFRSSLRRGTLVPLSAPVVLINSKKSMMPNGFLLETKEPKIGFLEEVPEDDRSPNKFEITELCMSL